MNIRSIMLAALAAAGLMAQIPRPSKPMASRAVAEEQWVLMGTA